MKPVYVVLALLTLLFAPVGLACDAAAETVSISHQAGTTDVTVGPRRIVVMDYGTLDTIDCLMQKKLISGDISLALPKAHLPAYLSQYRSESYVDIGSLKDFNIETIAGFKPDLIIASLRQADFYQELGAIAPCVVHNNVPAPYWEGVLRNIRNVGLIFGVEQAVDQELAELEKKADATRLLAQQKNYRALVLLTNDGKISAYGSGSRFGVIHDRLGLAQADSAIKVGIHGQLVNYEYIAMKNPDIIFVVDRSVAVGGKQNDVRMLKNDLVDGTGAAKNGRIVTLDPAVWYLSGGGLESLSMMIDEVRQGLAR